MNERNTTRLALIRASAGAGKTYRLTGRYIALLVAGADPSTILATTFTRKAAGEILGRVLVRVADAAVDPAACAALNQAVAAEQVGQGRTLAQADFRKLLTRLVRGLDQLAISTIDGFFSRCVSAFALELGVPSQPVMTDDGSALARDLRAQAIDTLLEASAGDDLETLLALLRQVHFDGARQSVAGSLDRVLSGGVDGLFDTYRQARGAGQWPALRCPQPLPPEAVSRGLEALQLAEPLLAKTSKGAPNKNWLKGWSTNLQDAAAADWGAFLKRGLAHAVVKTGMYYKQEADADLIERCEPLVTHAIASLITQLNHQTLSTHQLLDRFAGGFETVCREQQVLFYADLTDLLVRKLPQIDHNAFASGDESLASGGGGLGFRMDRRVQHLLIDEFQDTSIDQYRVLWPLIEEVAGDASSDRSFFCVGDAKQSIYGWRGGRVELFDRLDRELGPFGLKRDQIATSYRSSQVVLDAVNQVFGQIDQTAAWPDDAAMRGRFAEFFDEHRAARDLPGHMAFATTVRAERDTDAEENASQTPDAHEAVVAERVARLHRVAPGRSIAVLTRSNAQAAALLSALRRAGVPASGEGGAVLTDHPAVAAVLAALTLADHPGDRVAAFHVYASPLNGLVQMPGHGLGDAKIASAKLRRWVLDDGIAGVIARMIAAVRPQLHRAGLRRMEQLLLFAESQQIPSLLRPSRFVQAVQRARVPDPEAAPVTVMTIHKSKGLEFDAVFLPTLAARGSNFAPLCVEDRESETGPIHAVYRAGDQAVRDVCEPLRVLHDQAKERSRFEDLCTLYVAMTRAKHALYLLVPPAPEKTAAYGRTTFAALLTEAFGIENAADENAVLHEAGDPDWYGRQRSELDATGASEGSAVSGGSGGATACAEGLAVRGAIDAKDTADLSGQAAAPDHKSPPLPWTLTRGIGRIPRAISPSAPDRAKTVEAASLLRRNAVFTESIASGAAFGDAVHGAFERIGFVDDPDFDLDAALANTPDQVDAVIRQALQSPEIQEALSRRGAAGLFREHRFVCRDGRTVLRGQIDRLVWWEDDVSNVLRAEVIDFKTDRPPEEETAGSIDGELQLRYRDQMLAYREAVAELLDISVDDVAANLVWVTQGRCVTV